MAVGPAFGRSNDTRLCPYDDVRIARFRTGAARPFEDNHLHDMSNETGDVAYSLHAYSPELGAMTRYAWDAGRLVVTEVEASERW